MKKKEINGWLMLMMFFCVSSCVHQPPKGDTPNGYSITGIVGKSLSQPSADIIVELYDRKTGMFVSQLKTDLGGGFHFKNLPPGSYNVKVEDNEQAVDLSDGNRNLVIKTSVCPCCPKY